MDKNFEQYLNDTYIKSIIKTVCGKYPHIDEHDKSSISMVTLWNCIEKYDNNKGAKFTTYFYQQLSYALKNELKKKNREFASQSIQELVESSPNNKDIFRCSNEYTRNISEYKDIMLSLPDSVKKIIHQRFNERMTMKEIAKANGYSRETARRRLKTAIQLCKKMCRT